MVRRWSGSLTRRVRPLRSPAKGSDPAGVRPLSLQTLAGEGSWQKVRESDPVGSDPFADSSPKQRLSLHQNLFQVPLPQKTLPINLAESLSPTRPRRKPPIPGRHLQPTNRRAITRRRGHGLHNRVSGQLGKRQVLRLQGFQLLFLLRRGGEVFTAVHRRAVFSRQLGIILTRQLASLGANIRRQQAQNNAVFVGAPGLALKGQKTRAGAF